MSAPAAERAASAYLDLSRLECLGDALRDAMVPFKSNVALIECDRERETKRLTYAALRAAAERRGALFQAHGLTAGDRVAIVMSNQAEWIITALAALWSGAVLVPLDFKLSPAELGGLIAHARPRALVTEHLIWQRLREEVAGPVGAPLVLVCGAPAGTELDGAVVAETETAHPFRYTGCTRQQTACVVYTSGTGGDAKGCMLSHHNYLVQAQLLGNLFPVVESDCFFSILPTNHAIDFMCGLVLPLLSGGSILHQRTLRPQYLISAMERYRPTHMALVPMILRSFCHRIEAGLAELPGLKRNLLDALIAANQRLTERRPLPRLSSRLLRPISRSFGGRLRLVVCGGATVDRQDANLFFSVGIPLAVGYGLTEACTVVTVNDLQPFRSDTVGKPLHGLRVEVRGADADGVGEIWVAGDTVMQGYLDAPELTAEVLCDGWLRTGDLGRFDASGHLKLLGRTANMIVTDGGKNVYPEDVEAALGELPEYEESCVMAANFIWPRRDLTNEELVIVLRPVVKTNVDTVIDLEARNRNLAPHKRLSAFLPWEGAFPRTASMKIKRRALAEQIRDELGRDALVPLNGSREK